MKVNANIVANRARQVRQLNKGKTLLILEGRYDGVFYSSLIDKSFAVPIVADGRDNAIGALRILKADNQAGVLVILDADLDYLKNTKIIDENICYTDIHDIETMMFRSSAFQKVLDEIADDALLNTFFRGKQLTPLDLILNNAKELGYLRWANKENGKALKFRSKIERASKPEFNKFLNSTTLTIEIIPLIETIKNFSELPQLKTVDIQKWMDKLRDDNHDLWQLSNGHDMARIFAYCLRKHWAKRNAKQVEWPAIEQYLRLAYQFHEFQQTNLYSSLKEWELKNSPYSVLKTI